MSRAGAAFCWIARGDRDVGSRLEVFMKSPMSSQRSIRPCLAAKTISFCEHSIPELLLLEPEVRELQRPRVLGHVHHGLAGDSIGHVGVDLELHAHFGAGELGEVLDDVLDDLWHLLVEPGRVELDDAVEAAGELGRGRAWCRDAGGRRRCRLRRPGRRRRAAAGRPAA